MADILLEVCVDDRAGLDAAIEGGADRIELCSALSLGGLTPSAGLMSAAGRSSVPCYAMIRPRAGDFVYSVAECDIMINDILFAASSGLAGVVFGANLPDGRLDRDLLMTLSQTIGSMPRTLHRAFDLVPDLAEALDIAVGCGFERILTSGRKASAVDGLDALSETVSLANGRLSIMPGSGVNPGTVDDILARLAVKEVHSSCSTAVQVSPSALVTLGFSSGTARKTDAAVVRVMKERLRAHSSR